MSILNQELHNTAVQLISNVSHIVSELPYAIGHYVRRKVCNRYTPSVEHTLRTYGSGKIRELVVFRTPFTSFIDHGLNFITVGYWENTKQRLDGKPFFHVGFVAFVEASSESPVLIEKLQTINISPTVHLPENTECLRLHIHSELTLSGLLEATQRRIGEAYFRYEPFRNNCCQFAEDVLLANNLASPDVLSFIKQPINNSELASTLPVLSQKIAQLMTDAAATTSIIVSICIGFLSIVIFLVYSVFMEKNHLDILLSPVSYTILRLSMICKLLLSVYDYISSYVNIPVILFIAVVFLCL